MIDPYYKDGRLQWKTYCSSCGSFLGDTAPGEQHVKREVMDSGICPSCKQPFAGKEIKSTPSPRQAAKELKKPPSD